MQTLRRWRFEAFLIVLAGIELATVAAADVPHKPAALVITALSVAVLAGRRWQPLPAVIAAFALLTVSVAVMPRSTTAQFFGTLVTFVVAGAIGTAAEAVVAWLAGAAMLAYAAWVDPLGGGGPDFLLSLAFGTTMWGAGMLVVRRGRHLAAVIEQAAEAEANRQTATRQALADERAAIARELHDVVSHGLSVVVVQTLAARGLLGDIQDPATREVDRHLGAVEDSARDALGEMRRMLGLLQNGDDSATELASAPSPGLRHIEELVNRTGPNRSAIRVGVQDELALGPGLELTVYRIVQEGLTNVLRYAPGAAVDIDVRRAADRLVVAVINGPSPEPPAQPQLGAGRGLVGVRQRADLYGADVSAGATPDGGFALTVSFPETFAPEQAAALRAVSTPS